MISLSVTNHILKKRRILPCFLFCALLLFAACTGKKHAHHEKVRNCIELQFPTEKEAAEIRERINADEKALSIDTIFQKKADQQGFNGTVLIAQNGVILYRKAFGFTAPDRKIPLKVDNVFQLASVTKTFTAVATLILADRRQLSLDDSIQVYLPEFLYHGILIRNLLCHRSGLPNYIYSFEEKRRQGAMAPSNDTILKWFSEASPLPNLYNRPDVAFSYNNTNFILLASIIEKVSGMSYADFLRTEIFEPLGMVSTFVDTICSDTIKALKTTGFDRNRKRERDFYDGVYGDKGIFSTIDDMLRWYMAINSSCLVSRHLLREAFTPRSMEHKSWHNYGYGFRLMTDPNNMHDVQFIYHGGWWAGYSSMFTFDLEDDYVIIVLSNRKNASVYENKAIMDILDQKPVTDGNEEIDSL